MFEQLPNVTADSRDRCTGGEVADSNSVTTLQQGKLQSASFSMSNFLLNKMGIIIESNSQDVIARTKLENAYKVLSTMPDIWLELSIFSAMISLLS